MKRWLWHFQYRWAPYLFLLPPLVLMAIFLLYPLARSITLSLQKTAGPRNELFVGLGNYRFLVQDRIFWWAVLNTGMYAVAFLLVQIPSALGLALLLNSKRVIARNLFRFAFFSTHLVGSVFVAIIFSIVLSPRQGLLNRALGWLLMKDQPVAINWLGEPRLAMPAVLLAALWISIGYGMVYFLAALQSVDHELYDAAHVDGAGRWSRFWHVTLPSIRPVLAFMVLVGTIGALQLFELPYVLFNNSAGPDYSALTIVMYLFVVGFDIGDLGYASAIGWALVLLIAAVAYLQLRVTGAFKEAT